MVAGISTACFYPEHTEVALKLLADHSVEATEVFLNSASELEDGFLAELRRIADAGGTRIISVHPFTSGMEPMLFFSRYDRRHRDGREFYKRYYHAANMLGAEIVVFHGNFRGSQIGIEEYAECYAPLVEDARTQGISLCHENVSRCAGHDPYFFRQLSLFLPDCGYVLDVKQTVRSGHDVTEYLETMGKRIQHVHISDHTELLDCLPPGKGTFNIQNLLQQLDLFGFDKGVVVELYRENFKGIVEILEGYQQLYVYFSTLHNN